MFGLPVMKALPIAAKSDLDGIARYAGIADRLLFDARAPREATRPGGLGRPFDWHLLENLDPGVPFMLSGGLDAANVGEALRITRAPASTSPRVSSARRAKKIPSKICAFVRAARVAAASVASPGMTASSDPTRSAAGPNEHGHFGIYGGRFVAETLMPLILQLEQAYAQAKADPAFQKEMGGYLTYYVGRLYVRCGRRPGGEGRRPEAGAADGRAGADRARLRVRQ